MAFPIIIISLILFVLAAIVFVFSREKPPPEYRKKGSVTGITYYIPIEFQKKSYKPEGDIIDQWLKTIPKVREENYHKFSYIIREKDIKKLRDLISENSYIE